VKGADPLGWVGATLESKYRIDALVGEGGFGFVYRGTHLRLGTSIAVKFLRPDVAGAGEEREKFLRRFVAEGRLLSDLSRATVGVVQAHDLGIATSPRGESTPFIVMEWLDGWTLADELARHPTRSLNAAIELLAPVLDALVIAHEMGIVHRDLKPANLMLCRVGKRTLMKVLDFGIAQVIGTKVDTLMGVGAMHTRIFSAAYAAPEQFDPSLGATGPWTDVYAFGLILIEVVDGPRTSADFAAARSEALNLEARPSLRSDRSLDDAMRRILAVDPRNRPRTAGELRDLLRKPPTPVITRVDTMIEPPPKTVRPPPKRGRSIAWLLIVPAVLLLLGTAGVVLYSIVSAPTCSGTECDAGRVAPAERRCPSGMVLLSVGSLAPGSFPLCVDRTEVTVADYKTCLASGECRQNPTTVHWPQRCMPANAKASTCPDFDRWCNFDDPKKDRDPVNCVDWDTAKIFCASKRKRLPTREEWKDIATGIVEHRGCVYRRGVGTCPVGSTADSTNGVQDLAGNLKEWTSVRDGPWVVGGGWWDDQVMDTNQDITHDRRDIQVGFRCVTVPP
jgi:serine/threonine-protein kinase